MAGDVTKPMIQTIYMKRKCKDADGTMSIFTHTVVIAKAPLFRTCQIVRLFKHLPFVLIHYFILIRVNAAEHLVCFFIS